MSNQSQSYALILVLIFISLMLIFVAVDRHDLLNDSQATIAAGNATLDAAQAEATNAIQAQATLSAATLDAAENTVSTLEADLAASESDRMDAVTRAEGMQSRLLAYGAQEVEAAGDHPLAMALAYEGATLLDNPPALAQQTLTDIAFAPGMRGMAVTEKQVYSVAFSPDSQSVLIGAVGQVLLWDVHTRQTIRTFDGLETLIQAVDFSPDGTQVVAIDYNGTVMMWDVATGEKIREFAGPRGSGYGVEFSPDGTKILAGGGARGGSGSDIVLWDVQTGELLYNLEPSGNDLVYDVTFSPDGQYAAAGATWHQDVDIWDVDTGELALEIEIPQGMLTLDLDYSPDGSMLAAALSGDIALIWNAQDGKQIRRLRPSDANTVSTLAFSPDSKKLVIGTGNGLLFIYDTATWDVIQLFTGHSDRVQKVKFSPDGTMIVSGGGQYPNGEALVWDLDSVERKTYTFEQDDYYFPVMDFSPDTSLLIGGEENGMVHVLDLASKTFIYDLDAHSDKITAVAINPDNTRALTAAQDGQMILWNLDDGTQLTHYTEHTDTVSALTFSPDGTTFASSDSNGITYVWNADSGEVIAEYTSSTATRLVFSHSGSLLAIGTRDGGLKVVDLENEAVLLNTMAHRYEVHSVSFSPDDTQVVAADRGAFTVWNIEDHTLIWKKDVPETMDFYAALFHPSGTGIVTGGNDRTEDYGKTWGNVILWDIASGEVVSSFTDYEDHVSLEAFAPDGTTLYTATSNQIYYSGSRVDERGTVVGWRMDSIDSLIAWVDNNRYIREFTCDERLNYAIEPLCGR